MHVIKLVFHQIWHLSRAGKHPDFRVTSCLRFDTIKVDFASVKVKASIAKNGKEAEQPVPLILVNVLTALKANVRPNADDRVFLVLC